MSAIWESAPLVDPINDFQGKDFGRTHTSMALACSRIHPVT